MTSTMSLGWHKTMKYFIFGKNLTNADIASIMLTAGWAYTLFFVGVAFVRKQAAPYGKHADKSSILTSMHLFLAHKYYENFIQIAKRAINDQFS